ncbi:MAG: EVE domain-containing protein [Planctomycetota bacterium]
MNYWLFKTEPDVFSIEDLRRSPKQTTAWEGVRNYQARNLLRDEVRKGDGVLFYHSSANPRAVAGTAKVVRAAYPDVTQFDQGSKYFDSKATPDTPRWFMVDIKLDEIFASPVTLDEMRGVPKLEGMMLLKRGARLSIQPVSASEWRATVSLGRGR